MSNQPLASQRVWAFAVLASAQDLTPQNMQTAHTFERQITRPVRLKYLLFLPRDYDASGERRWPMIVFLHGAGERGTNLAKVKVHGPPKIVKDRPDFPFLVLSPQCPAEQSWDSEALLFLVDEVMARHRVDPTRVYLTGLSMGGYGAWRLGTGHPERFAALAPICGGGDTIEVVAALYSKSKKLDALRGLGVWAFHGAKDPLVPLEESQRMVNILKSAGCPDVKLTIYPEAGHDSWTETYDNPELYEWLLRHERKSNPPR